MRLTAVAGAGWLAAVSAAGCQPREQPSPRTSQAWPAPAAAADHASAQQREPDPDIEPPPPRSESQLAHSELEKVLATARPLVAAHDVPAAMLELSRCANKLPQSGECEALLAIVLLEHRLQLAHAHHYLAEVVAKDHPDVSTDQLRELARLATSHGRFVEADKALAIIAARGDEEPDALPGLAQLRPGRLHERRPS